MKHRVELLITVETDADINDPKALCEDAISKALNGQIISMDGLIMSKCPDCGEYHKVEASFDGKVVSVMETPNGRTHH